MAWTTALPSSSWMSVTTTAAPSLASSRALARPMPLAPPVTSATLPVTRSAMGVLQLVQEFVEGRVEAFRVVDVRGVAGIRDDCLVRARNLGGHVVRRGEERRVLLAHDDDGRDLDVGQRIDHAGVLLRQHPAAGARQAGGVAVLGGAALGTGACELAEAVTLVALGSLDRVGVPAFARVVLLVSG